VLAIQRRVEGYSEELVDSLLEFFAKVERYERLTYSTMDPFKLRLHFVGTFMSQNQCFLRSAMKDSWLRYKGYLVDDLLGIEWPYSNLSIQYLNNLYK
jgi:hypothetical protein